MGAYVVLCFCYVFRQFRMILNCKRWERFGGRFEVDLKKIFSVGGRFDLHTIEKNFSQNVDTRKGGRLEPYSKIDLLIKNLFG